jgi:hypothetical protein
MIIKCGGTVLHTSDKNPFNRAVVDLLEIREKAREKMAYNGDPIWQEYGRIKASFIRLAVLVGEPDAARRLIEGSN